MSSWHDLFPELAPIDLDQLPDRERENLLEWMNTPSWLRGKFSKGSGEILKKTKEHFPVLADLAAMLISIHWAMFHTPESWEAPRTQAGAFRRLLSARAFTTAFLARDLVGAGFYQDGMSLIRTLLDCYVYQRAWRVNPDQSLRLWTESGRAIHSGAKARQIAGATGWSREYEVFSAASHAHANALTGLITETKGGKQAIILGPFFNAREAQYCLETQVVLHRNIVGEFAVDHPALQTIWRGRIPHLLARIDQALTKMEIAEVPSAGREQPGTPGEG